MFTPVNMRSANAYRTVSVETSVTGADPHQLVGLLYDALLQSVGKAKVAIEANDIAGKGQAIGRAVRLIEEGLKAALNDAQGGELAANLRGLYDYCIVRLSEANLHTDKSMLEEVEQLIRPVAEAWNQIRSEVTPTPGSQVGKGA